jgi:aminoacylase
MKCVGIQYLETIRKYITENLKLKRTIHICFTPGKYIIKLFSKIKLMY